MSQRVKTPEYTPAQQRALEALCADYRGFLDEGKTERECVRAAVRLAEAKGYRPLETNAAVQPGDKLYAQCMGKSLVLFHVGSRPLEEGMNILGAHIDSPRLDVKQNPLYQEEGCAYLDTHYYGGIKKYQWVALPLAIHGVVVKKDGAVVSLSLGEQESDPVFCITDLLPHLGAEQMEKKGSKVVEGEDLNVLIASLPMKDTDQDAVKANVLKLLEKTYGIDEDDFLSAELEIVPAGRAREAGLDRSMILSYGQDDRVCAYTSLAALLDEDAVPQRTACCLLLDKEEIGSVGATGAHSRFFENTLMELMNCASEGGELKLRRCLTASSMLSSDVSAAFDPLFASVFEKKNAAFAGRGVVFNKYTGARGKASSNDANAEYLAQIRRILDDAGVLYQTAELGRVDAGGGGTIAYILANLGMNVVDCGVAVFSMHAPWELTSKIDVYETYRCYRAFIG